MCLSSKRSHNILGDGELCLDSILGMQAHDCHFSITPIYKMNPSPRVLSRLQAMASAKIYIIG
jgi:hypothetical protein